MMETKFRAWDKENKRMHEVGAVHSNGACHIKMPRGVVDVYLQKGEFELMQYTGLKDKNGKEIYSGYILNDHDGHENIKVEFIDGAFEGVIGNDIYNGWRSLSIRTNELEIIGNIWENPELL